MKRKTKGQLQLEGTYREDRHGSLQQKGLSVSFSAPKPRYLGRIASAEWDRVVPLLVTQGSVADIDASLLASYCTLFAHWRASEDDLQKNGLVLTVTSTTRTGSTTKPVPNPSVRNAIAFHRAMMAVAGRFGITPLDRGRLDAPPPEPKDRQRPGGIDLSRYGLMP